MSFNHNEHLLVLRNAFCHLLFLLGQENGHMVAEATGGLS